MLAAPDPAALRLGLHPGLTLAEARARVSPLTVADADPLADDALIERIADWCDRYTPLVARYDGNGLMLDITGAAHLFGGEASLLADVTARLAAFGLTASGVIAGVADAARALVRVGRSRIVEPGREADAVRPLAVAALGLDEARSLALVRSGLKTIGDLADRPRSPLAARFGAECVDRLQRLLGEADHPISPRRPIAAVLAERIFFEPLSRTDDIDATLASLAETLASLLETRGEGGRAFEASFYRVDGLVRRLQVATARPSRDPKALARLFHERLESLSEPLDAGFGFDLIRLGALRTEPFLATQSSLDGRAVDDEAICELVDRLGARFGAERILRFLSENTHIPERGSKMVPAIAVGEPASSWEAAVVPGEPPLRPLSLFDPPQPVEALAEVPDGPPLRFRWRRMLHEVARAEGPERIAPEWWRGDDSSLTRDYYRVEDGAGRRFWLYREGLYGGEASRPRWFLHGLFA